MQYNTLGQSDLKVSEISLGCWTMGGLNWVNGTPNGWANVDEKEITESIHYALDQGVNHFDNADVYGNGRAERMLARILGDKSRDVIIATKTGHFPGTAEHGYDALHVRHQCEQSLKNLKRDVIDLYYFHHGNFGPGDQYLEGALETVLKLKEQGKIREIGLSAYNDHDFARLVPQIKPVALQANVNLMNDGFIREGSVVSSLLKEYKMSMVCFGPINKGLLLGKYSAKNPPVFEDGDHRKGQPKFSKEALVELEPKIEQMKSRFGSNVEDLGRAVMQYLLHHDTVGCVIPGFRNLKQVKINVAAADKPVTDEEFEFLKNLFLQEN